MKYNKHLSRLLNKILDDCFANSGDMSFVDMAKKSRLSVATIHRLNNCEAKLPRFDTIEKLCTAFGMKKELERRLTNANYTTRYLRAV